MIRLHDNRLALLRKYLVEGQVNPALMEELLDHLACEAEERLWDGEAFEQVIDLLKEEASPEVLQNLNADLKALLEEEKTLTDMVFEGRNKQYGAYDLRKGYGKTIQRSLVLGVTCFLLVILLPDLYARLTPLLEDDAIGFEMELHNIDIRPLPLEHDNSQQQQPHDNTVEPNVITDEPNRPALGTAKPILGPPLVEKETELALLPESYQGWVEANEWEVKPSFAGGMTSLMTYIKSEINYPVMALKYAVEGRVFVGFTVGADGNVSQVELIKGIGYGCDQEALRVVTNMPNWLPGRAAGQPSAYRYVLPVSFEMVR
ncbi:protein TonB [Dyadobacter jejuensis]|uniref:Protein TonB n=1 Tax=Dyadobacter jejuensis TaxID=1082580 RepID=A0A316B750_9BACT|nr:energy transducer TonB [Dyadobacter jejuensis]PWJ58427.1 protein TonB [Dyadobacter jejuensis]